MFADDIYTEHRGEEINPFGIYFIKMHYILNIWACDNCNKVFYVIEPDIPLICCYCHNFNISLINNEISLGNLSMKIVSNSRDVPKISHFTILEYSKVTAYEPSYDYPNVYDTNTINTVTHYITTDQKEWEAKILKLLTEESDFVAFNVSELAEYSLKVDLVKNK